MKEFIEMTSEQYDESYKLVMAILESPETSEELEKATREFFETVVFADC